MTRLYDQYNTNIINDLKSKLELKNIFQVPKIKKIVLNMGIGESR
jgi:large subunit ribosomal protein L5